MPSLMLRNLPESLLTRLRAYRDAHGIGLPAAAVRLLTLALDVTDARRAGGHARAAKMTPEQRSESASRAAKARRGDVTPPAGATDGPAVTPPA